MPVSVLCVCYVQHSTHTHTDMIVEHSLSLSLSLSPLPPTLAALTLHYGDLTDSSSLVKLISEV